MSWLWQLIRSSVSSTDSNLNQPRNARSSSPLTPSYYIASILGKKPGNLCFGGFRAFLLVGWELTAGEANSLPVSLAVQCDSDTTLYARLDLLICREVRRERAHPL